jgi:hypothetical protein
VNHFLVNVALGAPGSKCQSVRALLGTGLLLTQATNRRVAKPEEQSHYQRSLSAHSRLVGLAQAARPPPGGSPNNVRNLAAQESSLGRFAQAPTRRLGREQIQGQPQATLGRFKLRLVCSRVSIKFMAQPLQLHAAIWRAQRVRPNPSIERTSTGWPRCARCSFSASCGQPVPAAHVKR